MQERNLTYADVISEEQWVVKMEAFWVNNRSINMDYYNVTQKALVDSGSSLIHLPPLYF